MEWEEGLHRISCTIGGNKPLYQHLLVGRFRLWVDAGICGTPQTMLFPYVDKQLDKQAECAQAVLVTHADVDHHGGLSELRSRYPGLVAIAHQSDIRWISDFGAIMKERYAMHQEDGIHLSAERVAQLRERNGPADRIDIGLVGGETCDLGSAGCWEALHAPGHTPGHVILWENERRTAVIGDAALGWGVPDLSGQIVSPPPYYDIDQYTQTLRMIHCLQPKRMYASHFPVMEGEEVSQFIASSLEAVEQLEAALAQILATAKDGAELQELCLAAGEQLKRWPIVNWNQLSDPLSAHLSRLIKQGKVEIDLRHPVRRYRRV